MFWAETWKISNFFIWQFSFFGRKIFNMFEKACFRNGERDFRRTVVPPVLGFTASGTVAGGASIVLFHRETTELFPLIRK